MRKNKRYLAVILCLLLALGLTACQKDTSSLDFSEDPAAESVQDSAEEQTSAETKKETKEKKETEKKQTSKAKETKSSTNKTKKSSGSSKKNSSKKESAKKQTENKKPSGHVLTVKKGSKKVYFTEKQLASMGKNTYKYSYRNKESEHRQFQSCTGVKFSAVLNKSGLSGSTARFHSTDGYTKEFSVRELTSSKKAFLKTTGSSAKSVPSILTLGDSGSFRLVFGQDASDTDEAGDYNAQYWVKWIDTIELY